MTDGQDLFIDVARLRVGMYIHLDLGWMDHPFSLNSFKIRSQDQIDTLRSLGLATIRYSPDKSDATPAATNGTEAAAKPQEIQETPAQLAARQRNAMLAQQRASLQACERKFAEGAKLYKQVMKTVHAKPVQSREQSEALIKGFVDELLGDHEATIRLLSEKSGEESSLHALNVTILSLLLGKAAGLPAAAMQDLGVAALLHDIGKIELPDRLRCRDDSFTSAERELFQMHVMHGIEIGRKMGLNAAVLLAVAQHHEHADGTGFPRRLGGDKLSPASRIVAITNRYDNLCNPANPAHSITPHEALSLMFAQMKPHFDAATMSLFIRMMGVYPPGSVVQLTDERYALVVSVNSSRPLKPQVIIHDPRQPREEAIVVDLEDCAELGIRRSLKPLQLPKPVYDYLSPRKRMCYFFERGRETKAQP
ncbi:HD domain-containing phosphohydrolase [Chitinivorax sp. PXF-14]|uniref:HD-GYP domain-containing protein n=1 Tax=Chitinivorax sp. PXF-14 TaxID=3230488 RepID=UPI003466A444